ncbi:glycine/sarcosine/betaine reductase selenoprotein B family protein [Teichococcus wenyumeiae]|nr:glycine/sarcosine/betaine reductase selenoprotein B family protein [Pseudoroseomonas wenyumeiae]
MSIEIDTRLGFAPEHDSPVPYMKRTLDYYQALGHAPYRWAHYAEVPFQPLRKPLAESRVALITTAAPYDPAKGEQGPGAAYNASAKFYQVYSGAGSADHDLRISHIAYDRKHSPATDPNSWFPLPALRRAAAAGRIGGLTTRFHGAPTNRSQRHTIEIDAPELLRRLREDLADAVVLVPNCPICHQTCSLVARHLEAHGIPTVAMGCAKDIVEHCGVPRFLFSDFPLGNSAGLPHDTASQDAALELALRVLEMAPAPRTTVQSPQRWPADPAWKLDYSNIERIAPAEVARLRQEFTRQKEIAKELRVREQI